MKHLLLTIAFLLFTITAYAADVHVAWDASTGATGYKIYTSVDNGQTWDAGVDVGDVTDYTYLNVPDTGLVLFRFSAYNTQGEAVRYDAMVAYCGDCGPPPAPSKIGID